MRRRRRHRLDYYALDPVYRKPGISSIELAEACRLPFENFRKREKQWEARLKGLVIRVRVKKGFQWFPRKGLSIDKAQKEWRYANKDK